MLLTAREVGELVGLSTETILRRWRRGEILGFRLATNVLRFDPVEVHAWVESCRAVASVGPRRIPFVIALAEQHDLVVVTSEKRGSPDHPKIPLVCEWRGVQCMNVVSFFRAEGWTF